LRGHKFQAVVALAHGPGQLLDLRSHLLPALRDIRPSVVKTC